MEKIAQTQRSAFQSPYSQYAEYIGLSFQILGEVPEQEREEEVAMQYNIRLANGVEIIAWPEEVFQGTRWEPKDEIRNLPKD